MKKLFTISFILLITLTVVGQTTGFSNIKSKAKHLTEFTDVTKTAEQNIERLNWIVKYFWTDSCIHLREETYAFVANDKLYTISYGEDNALGNDIERGVFLYCWDGEQWKKASEKIQTDTYKHENNTWMTESYVSVHTGGIPFIKPVSINQFVTLTKSGDVLIHLVCLEYTTYENPNKASLFRFYYKDIKLMPKSDGTYNVVVNSNKIPLQSN